MVDSTRHNQRHIPLLTGWLPTCTRTCGPTGATVTSINQAAAKMARAGILVVDGKVWRTVYYRFATREEREGKVSTNLIFKECRQSAAMKRVLRVYKRTSMGTQ